MALKQEQLDLKLLIVCLAKIDKDYNAVLDINRNVYSNFDYYSVIFSQIIT